MSESGSWCDKRLAICLSGGGYRAAAFHLGTLHYFHRVGLLQNLGALSTISGGSLLGAMYLLSLADGESFETFFESAYGRLLETDLVADALGLLKADVALPSARRNVITSVAEVYSESFFPGEGEPRRFGELLDSDAVPKFSINATEFRTGRAFRFRKSARGQIGASGVTVSKEDAKAIRVADMVAASACFPGGFEPLEFPHDFAWPGGSVPEGVHERLGSKSVALMDGGIFDNQGAEILDQKVVGKDIDKFGLFVISDVDQESSEIFAYPGNPVELGFLGRLKLGHAGAILKVVQYLCLLSCLALIYEGIGEMAEEGPKLLSFFLFLIPILLSGGAFAVIWRIRKAITENLAMVPKVGAAAWDDLEKVSFDQLVSMVGVRLGSLLSLTSSVFMKRIRSLVYTDVISKERWWTTPEEPADGAGGKTPKRRPRWIANLVYELKSQPAPGPSLEAPSERLREVATAAAGLPTSLWFEHEGQLRSLVACGQATACFNLLQHIVRRHGDDPEEYSPSVRALWDRASEDWKVFNQDPEGLIPAR